MLDKIESYILGLMQTDGHRGQRKYAKTQRISISTAYRDRDIIYKLAEIIGPKAHIYEENRITNFSNNKPYKSLRIEMSLCNFPYNIAQYIPVGKKSEIIEPPNTEYSKPDYWRGIIDGDGSLGLRNAKKHISPYISLCTASENLKLSYIDYIEELTGFKINQNRNIRGIYNIVIVNENAQLITNELYYSGCLGIDRKINKAINIQNWIRTAKSVNRINVDSLIGTKIHSWTILKFIKKVNSVPYCECICECGKVREVRLYNMLSGGSKSCGCTTNGKQMLNDRY